MKASIKKTDGTVVELEGTAEEIARVVSPPPPLTFTPQPTTINPYIQPIMCQHEYPSPWLGTMPPNCLKCGQPAGWGGATYTVVTTGASSSLKTS
jgi:hypothetical protein